MKDATEIVIVLDRSGSMATVRNATIEGYNEFLSKQKAIPGEAKVTLVQFDDNYEVHLDGMDLQRCSPLTERDFVPRGMTALHDAIGKTVVSVGARLAALPESERPDKVVFVVMTDGGENYSKEYRGDAVRAMLEEQTNKYNWSFLFVGANQDAVLTARNLGLAAGQALTYHANTIGTRSAYASIGNSVGNLRTGNTSNATFTDEDRKNQSSAK